MKEMNNEDRNGSETPKSGKKKAGSAPSSAKSTESPSKKKTAKLVKDKNAPKRPRSAYIIYMSMQDRGEFKEKSFTEIAQRWSTLSSAHKLPFAALAETEREQYNRQVEAYRKTDAYIQFNEKRAQLLKDRKRKEGTDSDSWQQIDNKLHIGDVSVFSTSFLQFNQDREEVCKRQRQKSSSLQEENRLLKENINRLKTSIAARKKEQANDNDMNQLKREWSALLISALGNIPISGVAGIDKNITSYMERLGYLLLQEPHNPVVAQIRLALSSTSFL